MTTFKVNDRTEIRCTHNRTRNGFCHRATLYVDGSKVKSTYVSYLNRTWESYQYETVLRQLLTKSKVVSEHVAETLLKNWGKDPELNGMGAFKSLSMVMKMGELLSDGTKKGANDWKTRMLKAGIPEGALHMPEDWDALSEDEKERRLNKVMEVFNG